MVSTLPHLSQLGSSLFCDLKAVIRPGCSIEDLESSFSGFGDNQRQSKEIVGIGKGTLAGADGYTISNSGLIS